MPGRSVQVKTRSPIYFRKFLGLPRVRRPLYRERIAANCTRVDFALNCPGVHDLAARLFDGLERLQFTFERKPCFLFELALCHFDRVLAPGEFAFWNGPRSEERRVGKEGR